MSEERENPGFKVGWVCFHCWEHFPPTWMGQRAAQAHFGGSEMREPACLIQKKDRGLLLHIRALELERDELRRQLVEEDSAKDRQMATMACEHGAALRAAEEEGYAKGLRDGRNYDVTEAAVR